MDIKKWVTLILLTIVIATAAACTGASAEATPTEPPPTRTPMPPSPTPVEGDLVDIGGLKLFIACSGSGDPTVVIEMGQFADVDAGWTNWGLIRTQIAADTRVCVYDRAGMGRSDSVPAETRTSQTMVAELHALLENAGVEGPYVLVGEFLGGLNVRLYADQYPDQVVGMVLVNSEHPDIRERLEPFMTGDFQWEAFPYFDWKQSVAQVKDAGPLGDMPLAVLMSNNFHLPEQAEQTFLELNQELVNLSSNGTLVIVEGSFIIAEAQPERVVEAIRSVLAAVSGE